MTRQQSSLLTFGVVLAGGSAIAAIVGPVAWIAYVSGALCNFGRRGDCQLPG